MNVLNSFGNQWGQILWTVSWQISVLVGLVWLVSLLSRKASPNFRYWLWCIVLLRLCLPMNLTLPIGLEQHFRHFAKRFALVLMERPTPPRMAENVQPIIPLPAENYEAVNYASVIEPVSAAAAIETASSAPQIAISESIGLSWFVLVIIFGGAIIWRFLRIKNRLKKCPAIERSDLVALCNRLCIDLGIKQQVQLRYMNIESADSPAAIGIFRPKVFLPRRIVEQWSLKEIEPILLHELAHIKRYDLVVNWLQMIVQVVYFFHPLVWLTNRKIRQLREEICDDVAIQRIGAQRKRYGKSILRVMEETRREPAFGFAGIGFIERKSSLARRIVRIMSDKYRLHPRMTVFSSVVLLLISILCISLASERLESAESAKEGNTKHEESQARATVMPEVEFLSPDVLPVPVEPNVFNIRGIVVNRNAKSIKGAAVTVRSRDRKSLKMTTGSDGRFVFEPLREGWWEILVEAKGYAHITLEECTIKIPRLKDDEIELILDRPVEMRGKVVNETGQPISGAIVIVAREWTADGKNCIQGHLTQDIFETTTDGKGQFSFNQLKPGKVSLVVEHPDYAETIEIFKSDAKDVVIKLDHGGTIRGRIVDADKPLAGVEVEIIGAKCSHRHFGYARTETDANGQFVAPNLPYFPDDPAGEWHYSIIVEAHGRQFPIYSLRLTKEQPVRDVLLQPSDISKVKPAYAEYMKLDLGPPRISRRRPDQPRGTATIKGKVIHKTRASAEGLKVHLFGSIQQNDEEKYVGLESLVDGDNVFEFSELPQGEYRLFVEPIDTYDEKEWGLFTPLKVAVKEGESKSVILTQDIGGIRGKVKGVVPALKWYVILTTNDPECIWYGVKSPISFTNVDKDNSYEIHNLAPGKYVASLGCWMQKEYKEIDSILSYDGTIEAYEFRCDGKTVVEKDFEVRLYEMTGKLIDAESEMPRKGITLSLLGALQNPHSIMEVMSKKDGTFRFPYVPSGEFKLKVKSKDDYPSRIIPCTVTDQNLNLGSIALEKSEAGILIQAKGPEPMKEVTYHYGYPSNIDRRTLSYEEHIWGTMQLDGTMVVKPVAPGHYTFVFNEYLRTRFDDPNSNALQIVEKIEVRPEKITRLNIAFETGIPVIFECRSGPDRVYVPFSEHFWLKDEEGQLFRFGSGQNFTLWYVNLKPGHYQLGIDLKDGKTKSIAFRVDQESRNKKIALELP